MRSAPEHQLDHKQARRARKASLRSAFSRLFNTGLTSLHAESDRAAQVRPWKAIVNATLPGYPELAAATSADQPITLDSPVATEKNAVLLVDSRAS